MTALQEGHDRPPLVTLARVRLVRAFAFVGAGLLVVATFVPINGGGDAGFPAAIFDRSVQRELQLFAAEPLMVAVLAILIAAVGVGRRPHVSGGMLLGFGVQTAVLFLVYTVIAIFGNPAYNSFEPGGPLGTIGAVLLALAGAAAVGRGRRQ